MNRNRNQNSSNYYAQPSSSSSDWQVVGQNNRRSQPRADKEMVVDVDSCLDNVDILPPLVEKSALCPYPIYKIPTRDRSINLVKLTEQLNLVLSTGPATRQLFEEVTKGIYPLEIVILRGLPGSGKSSVALGLSACTRRGITLSADYFFTNPETGEYNFCAQDLPQAHRNAQKACELNMTHKMSPIIIDNTNLCRWEMEPYVKMAVQYNYHVRLFEVETSWRRNVTVLSYKNTHGVAKRRIQDMLDRFEEVNPDILVRDVRRRMGDFGRVYNPEKNEKESKSPNASSSSLRFVPTAVLSAQASAKPQHGPPVMTLRKELVEELVNRHASPPKPSTISDFMGASTVPQPSNISPPPPRPSVRQTTIDDVNNAFTLLNLEKKPELPSASYSFPQTSERMAAVFPVNFGGNLSDKENKKEGINIKNMKQDKEEDNKNLAKIKSPPSEELLKSAQSLNSFFPACRFEDVYDLLERLEGDADEAVNILIDSGYQIAEEIVPVPVPDDFNILSSSPPKINDDDEIPSDFNIKLPLHVIQKLSSVCADPDDPKVQRMLEKKDGVTVKINPELAFKLYQQLVKKAELKAFKEAEAAAKD